MVTLVICVNAATTSIAADSEMQQVSDRGLEWLPTAEMLFIVFYCFELVLKLMVHRWFFFVGSEASWNIFDFGLVVLGLYDMAMELLQLGSGTNVSFARLARLLKITRLLRVLRAVRFVSPLRQMLSSIARSFVMLFWAVIVLMLIWWILALTFLQGLTEVVDDETLSQEAREKIAFSFGTIPRGVFTLFSISSGGDDWAATFHLVCLAGPFYGFVFLAYMSCFTFSLYNTLTGIVLRNVAATESMEDDERVIDFRQRKLEQGRELKRLFTKMDVDMSGDISEDEFVQAMRNPEILSLLEELGIAPRDASTFFNLLRDASNDDCVGTAHFIDGFMHMRGTAQGIDIQILLHQAAVLRRQVLELRQDTQKVSSLLDSGAVAWQRYSEPRAAKYSTEPDVGAEGTRPALPAEQASQQLRRTASHRAPDATSLLAREDTGAEESDYD